LVRFLLEKAFLIGINFLKKPSFAPPNWLFAPFWALFYILMAIAAFIIYKNKGRGGAFSVLKFYFFQLILNALWSIISFLVYVILFWLLLKLSFCG